LRGGHGGRAGHGRHIFIHIGRYGFDVIAALGLLLSRLIALIPDTEKRRDATEIVVGALYETVARRHGRPEP
jgi:hypothetical protein